MILQQFALTGNPIVEFQQDGFTRDIFDQFGRKVTTLTAEAYDDEAQLDYAPILRTMYRNTMQQIKEHDDCYLFNDYYLMVNAEIQSTLYTFIRGVLQAGEQKSQDIILTQLIPRSGLVECYPGYPVLISFLSVTWIELEVNSYSFLQGEDNKKAMTLFVEEEVVVQINERNIKLLDVEFQFHNNPITHPFYIRWINNRGGWDTWMFSCNQTHTRTLESNQYYEKYEAMGEQTTYHKEGRDVIEASSGLVDIDTYKILSMLQFSPVIQRYEPGKGWYNVQIDRCDSKWHTNQSKKELVISFVMPTLQMNR